MRLRVYDVRCEYMESPLGIGPIRPRLEAGGGPRGAACAASGFRLEGEIVRARAYATALGAYRLEINGRKAGDGRRKINEYRSHEHPKSGLMLGASKLPKRSCRQQRNDPTLSCPGRTDDFNEESQLPRNNKKQHPCRKQDAVFLQLCLKSVIA